MKLKTEIFGEVEIDEKKKLHFEQGLIGLPDLKNFFLLYDLEKEESERITWLQSVEDSHFSLPLINPMIADPSYNPNVEDELLTPLGEIGPEGVMIFITLRVPADITQMTVNMKAPIIINVETQKGCQVMVEGEQYKVRQPIYEILKEAKERKGE